MAEKAKAEKANSKTNGNGNNDEVEEVPAPEPPTETVLHPADSGVTVGAVTTSSPEVEADDIAADADEDTEISGDQVESVQGVAGTNGFVLVINGTAYAFSAQMTGALKQAVDQAVVGLAL